MNASDSPSANPQGSLQDVVRRLEEALERIIAMNRQTAQDKYGDAEKAESWSCVTVARAALRKTPNAEVSEVAVADSTKTSGVRPPLSLD